MVKCVICGSETGSNVINICEDCLSKEDEVDRNDWEVMMDERFV